MTKFSKRKISIIAAIAKRDRAIGLNNKLLWDIPADLRHFKNITKRHPVIMGQKTYESIGRPLPGRLNIVLTKDKSLKIEGCTMAYSIPEAINIATAHCHSRVEETSTPDRSRGQASGIQPEIFFIGGGQIYQQAIIFADRLYLTLVEGNYQADTFFPDYSEFNKEISSTMSNDNGYELEYVILEK